MRHPIRRSAVLLGCGAVLTLTSLSALADVGARGTRMSVGGGAPRFYMTYGSAEGPELYAPIIEPLRRLGVTFQKQGETYRVLHRGTQVAEWPVVTAREEVPERSERGLVLVLGGNVYVPVRKLEQLLSIGVRWDKRSNLVSLSPQAEPARTAGVKPRGAKPTPARPPAVPPAEVREPVILSAVEVLQDGADVKIRVRASGPFQAKWVDLQHLSPPRMALDFPGARWAPTVTLPQGLGDVVALRTGHVDAATARLALDLRGAKVQVTGLTAAGEEVTASIGPRAQAAAGATDPATEAAIRAALDRRRSRAVASGARGSRGAGLPELLRPGVPGLPEGAGLDAHAGHEHNAWRYIVIHHSASASGNLATFDRQHRGSGWDGVAYHFVITNGRGGPDGGLEVSPRWREQKHGAHAGGLPPTADPEERNGFNEFGIGICLVGNFEHGKPTQAQLATLADLLNRLRDQYGISEQNIMGHRHVRSTACPGRGFPWGRLFGLMNLPAPAHLTKRGVNPTLERCPWCLRAPEEPFGVPGVSQPDSGDALSRPLSKRRSGR